MKVILRLSRHSDFGKFDLSSLLVANLRKLADLPRPIRRITALFVDMCLCALSVWLAFSIRMGRWDPEQSAIALVLVVAIPAWLVAARWRGVYRSIIRFAGSQAMIDLAGAVVLMALPMVFVFMFVGIEGIPRTVGLLQPMIFLLLLALARIAIRYALVDILHLVRSRGGRRVAIYGAGGAGQQLGAAIRQDGNTALVGYIDDDTRLTGHRVDGIPIHGTQDLGNLCAELDVDEVLLALPSVQRSRRAEIVETLKSHHIRVRSLPSIGNIVDGKVSVRDLRDVGVEELLGRDPVPANETLLKGAFADKIVMVSGAGGSIGSELCRQIVARNPKRLILVDHSEFALYSVFEELKNLSKTSSEIEIVPLLGDVSQQSFTARIMTVHRPHTLVHAAAYKHVPLVEANPNSGLRNNVFSTYNLCLEAERNRTERLILVSTDKAVRPTNLMGASKRICELVLQARAALSTGPVFSMVRFGNVLGSSGSVVPLFRAQIAAGGPVTLTHRDVNRFFMTVPEAAQLVMQAGAMAKGGEVFVLDMGRPIRIYDLACSMIQLSGCSVRSEANPDGDIAIEEIGLRPGEKMFEELLIGNNPEPTEHSRIMRAREAMLPWPQLTLLLADLSDALEADDFARTLAVVRQLVPDYVQPETSAMPEVSGTSLAKE